MCSCHYFHQAHPGLARKEMCCAVSPPTCSEERMNSELCVPYGWGHCLLDAHVVMVPPETRPVKLLYRFRSCVSIQSPKTTLKWKIGTNKGFVLIEFNLFVKQQKAAGNKIEKLFCMISWKVIHSNNSEPSRMLGWQWRGYYNVICFFTNIYFINDALTWNITCISGLYPVLNKLSLVGFKIDKSQCSYSPKASGL